MDLNTEARVDSREKGAAQKSSLRIEAVSNERGEANRYTSGGTFRVVGRGFGEMAEVPTDVGLYLAPAVRGRLIRVFRYTAWSDTEIRGVWPAGAAGPQRLFVEIRGRDGRTRSAVFGEVLQCRADE